MKKIICSIIALFILSLNVFAQEEEKLVKPYYEYYVINNIKLTMTFIPLLESTIKNLEKEEKKNYKKIVKIEKYLRKNKLEALNKAYRLDKEYLPTLLAYYHYYNDKKIYKNMVVMLNNHIIPVNEKYNILDDKELKYHLAFSCYCSEYYDEALKYFKPLIQENLKYPYFIYVIADINYRLKNYQESIKYAKMIVNDEVNKKDALTLLFNNYESLKNKKLAAYYARELIKIEPNSLNYLRLIMNSSDNKEILNYAYKVAENYTKNNDYKTALEYCFVDIVRLEEQKIANAGKNIKGFVELPSYKTIFDNDYSYMKYNTAYYRLVNFYKSTNDCISKYYGNDLKACFASVNKAQEKITQKLISEKRAQEQMLAEEQRIQQMRLMNYNMMQQNSLIQQQNYQLSRPKYTNSTTTQFGNTYYTNSYSY